MLKGKSTYQHLKKEWLKDREVDKQNRWSYKHQILSLNLFQSFWDVIKKGGGEQGDDIFVVTWIC